MASSSGSGGGGGGGSEDDATIMKRTTKEGKESFYPAAEDFDDSEAYQDGHDHETGPYQEGEFVDDDEDDDGAGAAELSWRNLKVTSPNGKKVLLQDACGRVQGRFLAIMGPSGAGKTSLMNMLACRLAKAKGKGDQMMDGQKYNKAFLKKVSGYVMQDDLLFPDLTVKETLRYAAFLRMPAAMSRAEKLKGVDEVIVRLGLEHCKNVQVGSSLKKGISGGERKRLCVAIELLMKPRLLFLDEPTSGLDGVTALMLCRTLRDLAHSENCTVVCTIHQPATQIFNLFDDLMILKSGMIIYHGPADQVVDHYAKAGFSCPTHCNPADFVLDVISPAQFTEDKIREADENAEKVRLLYEPPQVRAPRKDKAEKKQKHYPSRPSWFSQVWLLFTRSMKNVLRARLVLLAQLIQTIIFGVLIGTVYLDIGTSQAGQNKRMSVLFFVCINQGVFSALILINSFPSERLIVLRERAAGTYYVSAYYVSKMMAEMVVQTIFPLLFSCIVYFLVGLQADAGKFFIFVIFMELCSLTATSMALMVSTFCKTVTLSITILPLLLEICRLYGGGYLAPAKLPAYFAWLDAMSFVKYSFTGIVLNELEGLTLYCTESELDSSGNCPITSGEQVIKSEGFDYITIWGCALVLIGMIVLFRTLAFIGLRFVKG